MLNNIRELKEVLLILGPTHFLNYARPSNAVPTVFLAANFLIFHGRPLRLKAD